MSGSKQIMIRGLLVISAIAAIAILWACVAADAQSANPGSVASATEEPKGKKFSSPEEAAAALYAAAHRDDESSLLMILGPDAKDIVAWSDDMNERQQRRAHFAQKYEQMHRLVKEPDDTVALYVGAENWPFPIPLIQRNGVWYFDSELGRQEIRYRRIGRNEMEALEVCRTLVDAEKEYHEAEHRYTAKFISAANSHEGLYWNSSDSGAKSPIGPYLAHAGVTAPGTAGSEPFHGYYYRILLQGSDGFRVLAFPAEYRSSGVLTFLVKQDGTAYEKDLGNHDAPSAGEEASSPPDSSWKKAE